MGRKKDKNKRYIVMARWWNGHGFDVIREELDKKKEVIGKVSLLVREVRPYQISITDRHNSPHNEPMPPKQNYIGGKKPCQKKECRKKIS